MVEKHDVVGLQCRAVEAPALRVEDVSAPSGPSASSASSPSVDPASSGRLCGGTAHLTALAAYVAVLETHRMGDSQPSSVVSPASDMSGVPGSSVVSPASDMSGVPGSSAGRMHCVISSVMPPLMRTLGRYRRTLQQRGARRVAWRVQALGRA